MKNNILEWKSKSGYYYKMEYHVITPDRGCIIKNWGLVNESFTGEESIGIWLNDNKLTDYDGVYEMSRRGRELLEQMGIDCSYLD